MSSRFVATVAVALAAGLAAGGCGNSGDGPAAQVDADLAATSPGQLFAANASGGTLRRGRGRAHRLTLSGLRAVTIFTDRPARKAGVESARQFVRRWRGRGFSADP